MLHPRFLESIISAWNHFQRRSARDLRQIPLPPPWALKTLLDECFISTLKTEEGQRFDFVCALGTIDQFHAIGNTPFHLPVATLEPSVPFTAAQLAKLAPAFDPDLSVLLVAWDQNVEELRLVGAAPKSSTRDSFAKPAVGALGL